MPEKIRIAHIVEATAGGTRQHVYDLISHSDFSRYELALICATQRDPAFLQDLEDLKSMGVRVCIVQMGRSIRPLRDLVSLWRICRVLRSVKPMLVHTHSSKAGFLGRIAARLTGVPLSIHTPHVFAFQMDVGSLRRRFYLGLERWATRLTDRIICVSESEKSAAVSARLGSPQKFDVVRNGIEMPVVFPGEDVRKSFREGFGIAGSEVAIGTLGRFYEQKGIEILLAATRGILQEIPQSRVLIAAGEGDPGIRRKIARVLERERFGARCHVLEPSGDAARFLAALDVFVLPSLWEGLPYVLLEAMAAGLPVVASRVGGVPEVLRDGVEGILVPAGDVQALTVGICRLASDPRYAGELGRNARKRVQSEFSMAEMLKRTFKVYDAALDITDLSDYNISD